MRFRRDFTGPMGWTTRPRARAGDMGRGTAGMGWGTACRAPTRRAMRRCARAGNAVWFGVIFLLALAGRGWGDAADGADAPPERPAYLAMVRADVARDAGRPRDALRLYQEAKALFEALAESRPGRLPAEAIAARIAYCREEADALRAREATSAARASVEAAAEIARLRARVAQLEAALAEARAERPAGTPDNARP